MRTVAIVGTGLIGTSIALALTQAGLTVYLSDADEIAAKTAAALGAGSLHEPAEPVDLAVIAVPPALTAAELLRVQRAGLARAYTDVASVKGLPRAELLREGADLARYVGGHPLAGRERSGPLAASADLFDGRYWALTPSPWTDQDVLDRALDLVALCGGLPLIMDVAEHDHAVALTSHAPHLVSSIMAALLEETEPGTIKVSGQGLRDVTRIGGGDAGLWGQILRANATAVADVLDRYGQELATATAALRALTDPATARADQAAAQLDSLLLRGVRGQSRIPRKPGPPQDGLTTVCVRIPDHPGELARLLAAAAEGNVNIEDVRIEHALDVGMAQLLVSTSAAPTLIELLNTTGWQVQD